jgi:predicted acetyltransferase
LSTPFLNISMNDSTIIFRKCTPKEVLIAKSIDSQLFTEAYVRDFSDDEVWIGWDKKIPIAYCSLRHLDGYTFLSRAGVIESHRGRGLQKRMIRLRAKASKRRGSTYIVTYTSQDNYASSNNLASCGFKMYEPEVKWSGSEFLYWIKTL